MQSSFTKNVVGSVIIILIGIYVYTQFGPPLRFNISSVTTAKNDLFTVQGEGKATAIPDEAQVTAGTTITKSTIKEAQDEVNNQTQSLLDALNRMNVAKKDIKTENYSVYPQYSPDNKISGYTVSSNFVITVRDLSQVNGVIDAATRLNLNQVGGVAFTLSDAKKDNAMQEARDEAVKQAKQKAEAISKSTGIRLGKLINAVETTDNSGPQPMFVKAQADSTAELRDTSTPVEPGSTDVHVVMNLSYETY